MSEQPRVYRGPDNSQKIKYGLLLFLLFAIAIAYLFLSHPQPAEITIAETTLTPRAPKNDIENESPPPAQPHESEPPPKPATSKPVPVAPLVAEPPGAKTQYNVLLKRVETIRGDGNRITAKLNCEFADESKDALIDGIGSDARVVLLDTGARKIPGEPWGYGVHIKLEKNTAQFAITTQLEDNESKIEQLDAMLAVVRPGPAESVDFMGLSGTSIGTVQKSNGFTFTIGAFKIQEGVASIETIIEVPPIDPLKPNVASEFIDFLKFQLVADNGALTSASRSGGGLGDRKFMYTSRFTLGASGAKAFRVSFVPRIDVEEFAFTLKNIEIPRRDIAAVANSNQKRGSRSVKSEDYTFGLNRVELKDGDLPGMNVVIDIHPPQSLKVLAFQREMPGATATDDLGSLMNSMGRPWFSSTMFSMMQTVANFRYPDEGAKSIASLKGTFEAYVVDEELSQEFNVSSPEKLTFPIEKGPVSLESFRIVSGIASFDYEVELDGLVKEKFNHLGIRQTVLDTAGNEISKFTGGGKTEKSFSSFQRRYILNDAKPSKLTVFYVTKGHYVGISFEFKDIEIPRGSKKVEYAPAAPGDF